MVQYLLIFFSAIALVSGLVIPFLTEPNTNNVVSQIVDGGECSTMNQQLINVN